MKSLFRFLLIALGFLSLILGIIGAFLPIFPTMPFLLITAYLFSRAHPPFYFWLLSLPVLGQSLKEWKKHGVIRRRDKVMAVLGLSSASIFLWFRPISLSGKLITYAIFAAVIAFVLSRPQERHSPHSKGAKRPGP